MADEMAAIERCAYCRTYVPVTYIDIPSPAAAPLHARVAVCDACFRDGR